MQEVRGSIPLGSTNFLKPAARDARHPGLRAVTIHELDCITTPSGVT
jgi:hypothetical protein